MEDSRDRVEHQGWQSQSWHWAMSQGHPPPHPVIIVGAQKVQAKGSAGQEIMPGWQMERMDITC